ncbi:hypothetical protein SAMN05216420_1199 [Nitrosospira sp. Nl5]|nr:hypothetical protein SAMN05216420_1199 [Nitrosospira sp. Nl5]
MDLSPAILAALYQDGNSENPDISWINRRILCSMPQRPPERENSATFPSLIKSLVEKIEEYGSDILAE